MRSSPPNSLNLFAGLFTEKEDNAAVFFLSSVGVTEEKVREYICEARKISIPFLKEGEDDNGNYGFLSKFAVNLVELAKNGKIDPLIGRGKEV